MGDTRISDEKRKRHVEKIISDNKETIHTMIDKKLNLLELEKKRKVEKIEKKIVDKPQEEQFKWRIKIAKIKRDMNRKMHMLKQKAIDEILEKHSFHI